MATNNSKTSDIPGSDQLEINGHHENTDNDGGQPSSQVVRSTCPCRLDNARFLLECDFACQYYRYYNSRLSHSRPLLLANARSNWGKYVPILELATLGNLIIEVAPPSQREIRSVGQTEQLSDTCIIVGTIFKMMKSQPNLITELNGDYNIKIEKYLGNYTSHDDYLMLQDQDESVTLTGAIDAKQFITGITVALLGQPLDNGARFNVIDVCYPSADELMPTDDSQIERSPPPADDIYIMFISDLAFSPDLPSDSSLVESLKSILDFVHGSDYYSEDERSAKVARIIVAGNCLDNESLKTDRWDCDDDEQQPSLADVLRQSRQLKPRNSSLQAIKYLDDYFAQLSETINVDVMPGESDPSVHVLPKQPFHPCMFPKSMINQLFNCVTNPHHAHYGPIECFGTSGQSVDVIKQYSQMVDDLEIMRNHLIWGHCAPNSPDNLYSVPYQDEDPFALDFVPDVYYAGCREKFGQDHYIGPISQKRTTILTIPSFKKTRQCVLLNIKDLSCQLITFK